MTNYVRTNYRLTGNMPGDITSYWYHGNETTSFAQGSYATAVAALIGYTTSVRLFMPYVHYGSDSTGAGGTVGQPTASYVNVVYATTSNAISYINIKLRLPWIATSAAAADTNMACYMTTCASIVSVNWDALVVSH